MYKSTTELKVRYAETDQMGVVHHSNYYVYFEAAREDFIAGIGMRYADMESIGIMMPLVETQCKYIEGARYGDEIQIETKLEELSPVKVQLHYEAVRKNDGKVLAKGHTVQTFVDSERFKIINLKKAFPDIWERFESLK
ncbi:MAG: thioesterase family protein [Bacillota bacterium]|nr:thioesterase family protein [Bacillota bacterium]